MQKLAYVVAVIVSVIALVVVILGRPAPTRDLAALNDGYPPSAVGPDATHGIYLGRADCEYQVTSGDTLGHIASLYDTTTSQLAAWNHIANVNVISVGECLKVTNGGTAPVPGNTTGGTRINPLEVCQSVSFWLGSISQWSVPPGCYSGIYYPNQASYPYRPGWGWCNWWPEEMHRPLLMYAAINQPAHSSPAVGAVVHLAPGVQGAGSVGHYAEVIAIHPGGYWVLVSEMNDLWRGGGWGRVNYRYVHVGAGVQFLY